MSGARVPEDYRRVRELCERYADADMGFVDVAVLAVVKRLGEEKLATLDERHFAPAPSGRPHRMTWATDRVLPSGFERDHAPTASDDPVG